MYVSGIVCHYCKIPVHTLKTKQRQKEKKQLRMIHSKHAVVICTVVKTECCQLCMQLVFVYRQEKQVAELRYTVYTKSLFLNNTLFAFQNKQLLPIAKT